MTQEQYKWLKDNGYDPTVQDVDDQGNIFDNPINAAPTQQKMSPLRAAGTSFLGNLLPSAAGLYAGAQTGALGGSMFGLPGTVIGGIGGGLAGGYGAGKLQEAALEEFAPSAIEEMSRAQTDQPVASYLGGFAPNALAMRPSFGGIKGLAAPLGSMSKEATRAAFLPAAANVGVNVAGSTAGQLVDMSQGGEFSAPRFAADVALGSIFSDPNKLGRKFGLTPLKPDVAAPEQAMDLGALRQTQGMTPSEVEMFKTRPEMEWWKQPEATRISDIEKVAKDIKQRMPKGMAAELAGLPEVYAVIQDPKKFPAFLASSLEEALNASHERGVQNKFLSPEERADIARMDESKSALAAQKGTPEYRGEQMGALRERAGAFTPEGGSRVAPESWTPEVARPTRAAVTTEEILGRPSEAAKVDEGVSLEQALKPTPEEVAKAEKIQADNARVEAEQNAAEIRKMQDLDAAQALSDEAATRLQSLQARQAELLKLAERAPSVVRKGVREQGAPDIAQAKQELADARAIADDLYSRLQRAGGEGLLNQADLDAATKLAAQRGLRIVPATPEQQAKGIRGAYVVNENGERVIYINPLAATADTAIHEIGHDVFKTSPNERMRRSLMDTAEGSESYKREYEARLNEGKNEQQARDIALEEGLVQAFGEAYPNVKPGEIRQWFNALKSSVKSMVGMKISPEDALAWMHYATTEAVPWKGVAVAKGDGTEERMQRAQQETPEFKNWFGESKVVDAEGKPLTVYHGTPYGKFSERADSINATRQDMLEALTKARENWNASVDLLTETQKKYGRFSSNPESLQARELYESAVKDMESTKRNIPYEEEPGEVFRYVQAQDRGYLGAGFYFTANKNVATGYSGTSYRTHGAGEEKAPYVYETYLSLKNPYTGNEPIVSPKTDANAEYRLKGIRDIDARQREQGSITRERLIESGFDGVIRDYGEGIEYVAFYPEQIKSATENKGTFDPSNPDIRYQRPTVGQAKEAVKTGLDKTLGEIDQITRRGGIFETVGRAMTRAYNTADAMLGKARSLGGTITKLNYGDATKLTSHLYNEYRNQQLLTPAPEIAAAYKEWRTQAKAFWVDESNKAGFKIDAGKKGLRDRIESEFWMPAHKLSDEAREILANKIGTPEYQKLKDDYLRDATDDYLSQGKLMTEAQEKALADFEEQRALNNKTFDPSAPATFAGARKPMGRPLPESWIEKDFRKLYESYNARSAKDYAAQEHFEKSPEVMAALGSKKFFNGQDIPADVLQNTDVIAPDPSVQSVMREFSGQPLQMPGKTLRSWGAAASALALQTISRIGDVGGTVTKPLAYIGLGDYGAYMGGMAEKLSDWSKLKARSIESGLNNPNANQDFHQVIGMGQDAGKYMQKVLDSIGFITGSSKLESVARTLAQAQGEMIVSINKRKAATGDKDAVRFLDTLNNDWRTQSDMALAAQFGQMMQGTYDMRQLPAWFLEGGAAPYLTWSKWSMSQMNNFRKFAVEPAMQGNLKPLIAQVLVGMAGGGAIEQVQEWLSGKESKAVKWSELESWARQNEGTIGTDGGELLLQKFMIMAQKTGTFGFAGDLAMMPINALVGDTQSSVGVFPAAELAADLAKNVAGALTAIDKGEDVGLVMQRFGKNVIVGKTQMARVASTWVDEVFNEGSENLRSSDRRKARLFEELSGTGRSNGMFPVSYENLAEQKFERGSVTEDTGEEAFNLVKTARESATSPEDYASRIRKLKTSQNAIMPSLERQPMKAARYLGFVEGAEPGKGGETLKRYYTRQNEDKYRKSLIEGMSGIR
jgi:hypothetical protein